MKLRPAALILLAVVLAGAGLGIPAAGAVILAPGADTAKDSGIAERPGHEFTYVCRDGGAGGYEAFPDVCRLVDGRLMAVFYAGYGHVSLSTPKWPIGGRIDYALSSDEGRTWTRARVLYDGPDDDRDPSIVQLPSGKLLCSFFSLRRKAGPAGEWDGLGTWLIESSDLGRTWSKPRRVSADYYCSSPIRLLSDGRLMLGLYRQDGEKAWGAVTTSGDDGRTWGPVVDIPNGGWKLDAETDIIPIADGRILAVEREPATSMCSSISADGGRTWSVSQPLGFPGHCPYLLRTSGGVLLLAHRLPGTSLHYSFDEGRTWSENVPVDERIGAYPSMVELKDGTVLIIYYEEGAGSNIRARRFRLGHGGLEWLTFDDDKTFRGDDPPAENGSPSVRISREGTIWRLRGARTDVKIDLDTLRLSASTPSAAWTTRPSFDGDLKLGDAMGRELGATRLASAARKTAARYRTGSQTGIKISLAGFRAANGPEVEAPIDLFVGLEGRDEDLVCRILAVDGDARVRELLWPASFEPGAFASTVVPFMQGMLLPKDWPRAVRLYDSLSYGRGLYMPWWGFDRKGASVLVLLETPDDAGCRFDHPAGGPTSIDVRWVHSLGRWSYPRVVRFAFLDAGGYVGLAKRYRRHVIETGRFVSLREKIARNPLVGKLVGAPVIHTSILYHVQPQSSYYDTKDPAKNHHLVTFDRRAAELEALAALGVGRAYVHLDGWGYRGYDNLHPDVLPPSPEAGGFEGMKRLADTCDALGFVFAIHDQYRDYYLDAPSYNPRNAQVGENGRRDFHSTWYGGTQTYLCPSLAPGHVAKNHRALLDHGVKLRGAYLDVFAVVPPDECYNPEHPVTRTECLRYRGLCFDFVRSYGGVVSSEEPADWAVAKLDLVHHGPFPLDPNPGSGPAMGIPVPLVDLVYHDSILLPWSLGKGAWGIPESDLGFLHGLGHAGLPYLSIEPSAAELEQVRTMCALSSRVGSMELVGHEFLEGSLRRQRFTYADGTAVTIDLDAGMWSVTPALEIPNKIR
jgi:photosystem II stability/assembly factor-like uncharacterized protein